MTAPDDPRAALARLVVQLRAAAPADRVPVVKRMLPLIARPGLPLAVRYAAAGRAVDAFPDRPAAVRAVARALTGRLKPARALARLRRLQNLTDGSPALDALVARRERKVRLRCPRCPARLPRPEMAKHLWHEHGLELAGGKVRTAAEAVEAVRAEHAVTADPDLIGRALARAGPGAVRAWAAETATAEEAAPLCAAARDRRAGLCPGCFAEVRSPVPELPPPLAVANGRVAGDGMAATAPVLSPPRVRATLLAAVVLLLLSRVAPAVAAVVVSGAAYLLGRFLFRTKGSPDDLAIDAMWRTHARRLTDRRDASRFLARLCVTSVGRGDPLDRANPLNALVARARANRAEYRLLAVAQALRMDDSSRLGRDRAAGMAELLAPAFGGELPTDFAELALGVYFRVPRDPGELARLRVLLLARAFDATLTPGGVLALCDAGPNLARALRLSPNHVALLYGVWANREARPWDRVGKARTVFDLVAATPTAAAKLLRAEPGLALVADGRAADLGPVLVSLGGVTLGGATATDPASEVRIGPGGRELVFGGRAVRAKGRLPDGLPRELRGWLRFRADVLAGYPTAYLTADPPAQTPALKPFVARCRECGTACLPVVGAIGRPLRA